MRLVRGFHTQAKPLASDPFMILSLLQEVINILQFENNEIDELDET